MDEDAKRNLRFMLATHPQLADKSIEELAARYEWVVGKESKIIPVSSVVVKQ